MDDEGAGPVAKSGMRSGRPAMGASASLATTIAVLTMLGMVGQARAASTSLEPSSPQPTLPSKAVPGGAMPMSPVVESTLGSMKPPSDARKQSGRHAARHRPHRHLARRTIEPVPPDLPRPAVAGVALLVPLPVPPEPPHITVPLPDYTLDSVVTRFTTPPTPIVCHNTPRIAGLPDPDFYRERTLRCEPDNP